MMNYKVVLPKVEVEEEANFTRKLRVWISGNPTLDLELDEEKYQCDFDVAVGKEFRVDVMHQEDVQPVVLRHTTDVKDVGKRVIDHNYVRVTCK